MTMDPQNVPTLSSVVYATRIGKKTIDQDWFGGNPFATALVEAAKRESMPLKNLLHGIKATTAATTAGLQVPVWELLPGHGRWRLVNSVLNASESRRALILVVASYKSAQLDQLRGAALDEQRVGAALALNGFSVTYSAGKCRTGILMSLRSFSKRSKQADVGLIYCTGHGAHTSKGTMLLPHDYPTHRGYSNATLNRYAIPVEALRTASQAKSMNVVFFAGCRTRG
jgi:Caspase domain